jgi:CDP-diacylglycerol--glycerol-3-phosphate 3-phosphatidyltransferase
MARWNVWLCTFTKPGIRIVSATRATLAGSAYCFAVSWTEIRRSIPNALTIARFLAIPVFIWLYLAAGDGAAWGAGIFFAAAALTDQLDGYLARRWHVESRFGKVADPLADRLMIGTAAILMLATGRIPLLAAIVIIGRDVILVLGYRFLSPGGYELEVTFLGKTATWALYGSLGFVLVTVEGTTWPLVLLWIGIVLSLCAGAQYALRAWRHVHAGRDSRPEREP